MSHRGGELTISPVQLTALLVLSRIEVASIFLPSLTTGPPTRDAWVAGGVGVLLGLGPLVTLGWLSLRYDGKCLVGLSKTLFGGPLGAAVGVVLAVFFLLCAGCTTRHVMEAYTSVVMPETPGLVFSALIVLLAVYAGSCGIHVLGRTGLLVFAAAIPLLTLVALLGYNQMDVNYLRPAFQTGLSDYAKIASVSFAFTMQAIAGAMLFPHLKPLSARAMVGVFSAYCLISMGLLVMSIAAVVASHGPLSYELAFPVLSLARRVNIANLIQRMEILPVTVWTASACMRISLFLWAAAACLTRAFGLKEGRCLVLPLGYLCVVITAFIAKSLFEMLRFYTWDVWGIYGTVLQLGLIILLVVASAVRTLRGGNRRAKI